MRGWDTAYCGVLHYLLRGQFYMENAIPFIDGIDTASAVAKLGGNTGAYFEMLGRFKREIAKPAELIREKAQLPDLSEFVILVHGVKGSARMLGMNDLGEEMYELECAGKGEQRDFIGNNLDRILSDYSSYEEKLASYDNRVTHSGSEGVGLQAVELLKKLRMALEDFESEEAERIVSEIGAFSFSGEAKELFEDLYDAIDNIDYFASIECVDKLLEVLNS